MNTRIKVVLADDHIMLRKALAESIEKFGYEVLFQCDDGTDLLKKLDKNNLPDIVLMDINMKPMNGLRATILLKEKFPLVNVLALSMYDDEDTIIKMLRNGAQGYIFKENEPDVLKQAIDDIIIKGFHYSEKVTGRVIRSIQLGTIPDLNKRHEEFLKWACTELTYKEIAIKMEVKPRTVDGYREELFEKLGVKSRVGLTVYAIKHRIVEII